MVSYLIEDIKVGDIVMALNLGASEYQLATVIDIDISIPTVDIAFHTNRKYDDTIATEKLEGIDMIRSIISCITTKEV